MFEKSIEISETNNPLAKPAVENLTKVLEKNFGLRVVAALVRALLNLLKLEFIVLRNVIQ